MVFGTEKNLAEHGSKISDTLKKEIEDSLAEARKVKDSEDVEEIKAKHEALQAVALKIGQEIYGGGSKGGSDEGEKSEEEKKEEPAEEADFKEKKK